MWHLGIQILHFPRVMQFRWIGDKELLRGAQKNTSLAGILNLIKLLHAFRKRTDTWCIFKFNGNSSSKNFAQFCSLAGWEKNENRKI